MRFNRMRSTLDFQRQTTTKDAMGQPQNTWTSLVVRRAEVQPLTGRETITGSGEIAPINVRIRLRYDSAAAAVRPYDRAVDDSVSPQIVYNILSVANINDRNREIVLQCERL